MKEPLVPTSSNDILVSLSFYPGKGQKTLHASTTTEGKGLELDLQGQLPDNRDVKKSRRE